MICILDSKKICNHCGLCDDRCELDPNKICDNCFHCLDDNLEDYAEILISDILTETDESAFEPASLPISWSNTNPSLRMQTMYGVKGTYKKH